VRNASGVTRICSGKESEGNQGEGTCGKKKNIHGQGGGKGGKKKGNRRQGKKASKSPKLVSARSI